MSAHAAAPAKPTPSPAPAPAPATAAQPTKLKTIFEVASHILKRIDPLLDLAALAGISGSFLNHLRNAGLKKMGSVVEVEPEKLGKEAPTEAIHLKPAVHVQFALVMSLLQRRNSAANDAIRCWINKLGKYQNAEFKLRVVEMARGGMSWLTLDDQFSEDDVEDMALETLEQIAA